MYLLNKHTLLVSEVLSSSLVSEATDLEEDVLPWLWCFREPFVVGGSVRAGCVIEPLESFEGDTELSVTEHVEVGPAMIGPSTQSSVKETEKMKCWLKCWLSGLKTSDFTCQYGDLFVISDLVIHQKVSGIYIRPRLLTRTYRSVQTHNPVIHFKQFLNKD